MNKAILVIFFLGICWVEISAQQFLNVVYLKNGSVIRGKILINTADSLKIETICKNIFVFNPSEVQKIEVENKNSYKNAENNYTFEFHKGFYFNFNMGLISGNSDIMSDPGYSLKAVFGYELSNFAGFGMGTGIEKFNIEMVPLFISYKSELLKRENSPVFNFNIGYSFPMNIKKTVNYLNYNYSGGICVGFDIGVCSDRTQKRAFMVSLGYQYQRVIEESQIIYYYGYSNPVETNTYDFNKLIVKIGFLFK
jgi:hypothetical protein